MRLKFGIIFVISGICLGQTVAPNLPEEPFSTQFCMKQTSNSLIYDLCVVRDNLGRRYFATTFQSQTGYDVAFPRGVLWEAVLPKDGVPGNSRSEAHINLSLIGTFADWDFRQFKSSGNKYWNIKVHLKLIQLDSPIIRPLVFVRIENGINSGDSFLESVEKENDILVRELFRK